MQTLIIGIFTLVLIPEATAQISQKDRKLALHAHAEQRPTSPRLKNMTRGKLTRRNYRQQRHSWPVKVLSIGHTIASYQRYVSADPYFHHGIDIRAEAGSDVLASAGGKVVNIENYVPGNPAYWEVAILDPEGFLWQYHHVDQKSIPREIHEAFKTQAKVPAGTKLGEVYYWSVKTFGERFHHIHLNVLGANGVFVNPFNFLKPLPDKAGPKINRVALWNAQGEVQGNRVKPPYSILIEAEDLIHHQKFRVPPYMTWISVNGSKPHTVWRFDSLPGFNSKTKFIHRFFIKEKTCGDYRCRRFAIDLGFSNTRRLTFPTTPGRHFAQIGVMDFAGNKSTQRFEWVVE